MQSYSEVQYYFRNDSGGKPTIIVVRYVHQDTDHPVLKMLDTFGLPDDPTHDQVCDLIMQELHMDEKQRKLIEKTGS